MFTAGSNQHVARTGGKKAKSREWKRERGQRVRALREKLGWKQDTIADRGKFPRDRMSKFESGDNAASTADALLLLANGFGMPRESMVAYLDKELEIDDAIAIIRDAESPKLRLVTTESEFRYPALRRVLEAPRYRGRWSLPAVAAARAVQLDADEDPGEAYWLETLDRLDAAINVTLPKAPSREADPLADLDDRPRR